MRVLVCGGRDYSNRDTLFGVLDEVWPEMVIEGGAAGADRLAYEWCVSRFVECWHVPADWKKHGKAAGPIRNKLMLDQGRPDLVVAFPGGRGTADMVKRARAAGVPVREVS